MLRHDQSARLVQFAEAGGLGQTVGSGLRRRGSAHAQLPKVGGDNKGHVQPVLNRRLTPDASVVSWIDICWDYAQNAELVTLRDLLRQYV